MEQLPFRRSLADGSLANWRAKPKFGPEQPLPDERMEIRCTDWEAADAVSSPFSIADYRVAQSLGGEAALAELRNRLAQRGIKLMLDFVPNHTAPEHFWVKTNREFYIAIPQDRLKEMNQGDYWSTDDGTHLACGRDPNFPAWSDTLQLNFANADLCRTLIEVLHQIAAQCDGVRCDMAMLMIKDVFNKTWGALAGEMRSEFWDQAIDVKASGVIPARLVLDRGHLPTCCRDAIKKQLEAGACLRLWPL